MQDTYPLFRISVGFYLFSTPLTSLNLYKNGIGIPDGWIVEFDSWGDFKHFKHDDGRTQEEHPGGVCSAVVALAEALVNTPLTTLDLMNNQIGLEGAKAIAAALPR